MQMPKVINPAPMLYPGDTGVLNRGD